MKKFKLTKPVAFFIFNRPSSTAQVFSEIRRARPPLLLLIGDGPRSQNKGEYKLVQEVRRIVKNVDWPCQILTNFSESNLGCKNRVATGLDWVFSQVDEAIILEDDCVPSPHFFRFCQELLEKYRDDYRVSMIGGTNYVSKKFQPKHGYYFSRYTHIWGWATWRRSWLNYDVNIKAWPEYRDSNDINNLPFSLKERSFWIKQFNETYRKKIDTWDYQWALSCWLQNGLSIIPSVNLISNIGFGPNATHTTSEGPHSNLKTGKLQFPLIHPKYVHPCFEADHITATDSFIDINLLKKIFLKIRRVFK